VEWGRKGRGEEGRRGGALEPRGAATGHTGTTWLDSCLVIASVSPLEIRASLPPSCLSFFLSRPCIPIRLLEASSCELGWLHLAWLLKGTVRNF
jgi:hypothetical protein